MGQATLIVQTRYKQYRIDAERAAQPKPLPVSEPIAAQEDAHTPTCSKNLNTNWPCNCGLTKRKKQ
jgi:hypothetical protein